MLSHFLHVNEGNICQHTRTHSESSQNNLAHEPERGLVHEVHTLSIWKSIQLSVRALMSKDKMILKTVIEWKIEGLLQLSIFLYCIPKHYFSYLFLPLSVSTCFFADYSGAWSLHNSQVSIYGLYQWQKWREGRGTGDSLNRKRL